MLITRTSNSILNKIISLPAKFIDFPSAIAGAFIMGIIVGVINAGHGAWPAVTAAMKQAAYTFLFGGMIIKLLYFMVISLPGKITGLIFSVLITSIVTITLVYLVHSLKGTPLPFESTLPTVILAPPGFFFLAVRKRNRSR